MRNSNYLSRFGDAETLLTRIKNIYSYFKTLIVLLLSLIIFYSKMPPHVEQIKCNFYVYETVHLVFEL